ncbi:glutathione S-transferase, partial [Staphylococcus aureus]
MTIKLEDNQLIFSRTIEEPIEKVFDAYATKALFQKLFHPKDAITKVFRFNAVSGGNAFYAIKTPTTTNYK